MKDIITKVVLLGDKAVGKTSIRKNFMGFGFTKSHLMTLGADFSQKSISLVVDKLGDEKFEVTFQIWDIAGQKAFQAIRKRFLSHASIIVLIFDLTRQESFNNLTRWLEEAWNENQDKSIPITIIGNKVDLQQERTVEKSTVLNYIKYIKSNYSEVNQIDYIETSALTGENINESFELMAKFTYQRFKETESKNN